MKKVILIAFYFNQVNEIASKRLRALAKYLPRFGWEVIVIVPDLGFIPPENKNLNSRIIVTEYEDMFSHMFNKFRSSNKNDKIDEIGEIDKIGEIGEIDKNDLKESINWEDNLDNSHNGGDFSQSSDDLNSTKLKDSSSVSNPIASKAISMAGEIFAYPDGMKYWHEPAFEAASKIVEEGEIDAIISSSWPITCHTIAKDISDKYNIPWIADLRDLWNLNPYVSHTFIRDYFEKRLELKTFENTDVLTTTTDLAAKTLATLHPNNRIVPILSGYDEDDFKFLESVLNEDQGNGLENSSKKDGSLDYDASNVESSSEKNGSLNHDASNVSAKLKLIYAGSLYGGKRDPTILFKAIRQLEDESKLDSSNISIEFYGDSGNLEEIARKYSLLDIVNIGGKIPHEEVLKKQLNSDVLLLISWNNEKEKMFIPGKIYEYFALRKPVLSIGYKEGSLKDLIEDTNVGYHVSDLESAKEVLLDIYNEFLESGKVEYKSEVNIDDYSMLAMASKFADLLNDLA